MASADINEELLRLIGSRLARHGFIKRVDTFPAEKPDRVVATLAGDLFPDPGSTGWLELRVKLNHDMNVIYIEDWAGDRWECRWDRHPNDHNTREHFHPPPVVTTATARDADLPDDVMRVVELVLEFVEDRIRNLWQDEQLIYPDEYEFDEEYGPDIYR